jgi:gamma-glutamyltranspeptidase/glutathione hydrolase
MVMRFPDGTSTSIDYREVAPRAASRDMYLDASGQVTKDGRIGPRAAGIPGVVAGLWLAHNKYGKLPWAEVLAPAIALARDGSTLDRFHADDMKGVVGRIGEYAKDPNLKNPALLAALKSTLANFSKPDGNSTCGRGLAAARARADPGGDRQGGGTGVLSGRVRQDLASRVHEMGGLWTAEDLASYRAVVREPVRFSYRGYEIVTMPPPSAAGSCCGRSWPRRRCSSCTSWTGTRPSVSTCMWRRCGARTRIATS